MEKDFSASDDPIEPPGVRDENLLQSAAFRPHTSLGDVDKYPTVEMAAAALLHSVTLNHAFFNGNKRTALVGMLVFLDENGFQLTCAEDQIFKFVLLVAQHRLTPRLAEERADREVLQIARWIKRNSRRLDQGERILKWIRFRRILTAHGCWTEFPGGGSRINIYRRVVRRGPLGRSKERELSSRVFYAGDGTDVERGTVAKVRKDLELDDEHGIDSQSFYAMEVRPAEDFIFTYRKTLNRLAKL